MYPFIEHAGSVHLIMCNSWFNFLGTLKLCVKQLLIQTVIVDQLFSLAFLNNRMASFFYGPDVTNKPSPISKDHIKPSGSLKQSGKHFDIQLV